MNSNTGHQLRIAVEALRPRVHSAFELQRLFAQLRDDGRIPRRTSTSAALGHLLDEGVLRRLELAHEYGEYRGLVRYALADATSYELALSIRSKAHLSHFSALFVLGLTREIPYTHYVNVEQSPKPPPSGAMSQAAIDRAFARPQRQSRLVYVQGPNRFVVLSGKHSGRAGVVQMTGPSGESVESTGIARTLIDSVVRPTYAGGVHHVLQAFRRARDGDLQVTELIATLHALDHRYPFHQAIGFLMERAGFDARTLDPLRQLGIAFDFHVGYGSSRTEFDPSWRVHFPEGLELDDES